MFQNNLNSISAQLKKAKNQKENNIDRPFEPEYEDEVEVEIAAANRQAAKNPAANKKPALKKERRIATPAPKQSVYPERTFDNFEQKMARLRSEDIDMLKLFVSEISSAKKRMPADQKSRTRITDNTILRLLVQSFCEKLEGDLHSLDFSNLTTESDLKHYIDQSINF